MKYFIFIILVAFIFLKNIYRKKLKLKQYTQLSENIYFIKRNDNKREYLKLSKIIKSQLGEICNKSISFKYFKNKIIKRSQYTWIYIHNHNIIIAVIGFPINKTTFYIDLFCSNANIVLMKKYFGVSFLKTIMSHIKKMNFKNISLRAGEKSLISYYSKHFGFKQKVNSCNKKEKKDKSNASTYSNQNDGYWMSLCI